MGNIPQECSHRVRALEDPLLRKPKKRNKGTNARAPLNPWGRTDYRRPHFPMPLGTGASGHRDPPCLQPNTRWPWREEGEDPQEECWLWLGGAGEHREARWTWKMAWVWMVKGHSGELSPSQSPFPSSPLFPEPADPRCDGH